MVTLSILYSGTHYQLASLPIQTFDRDEVNNSFDMCRDEDGWCFVLMLHNHGDFYNAIKDKVTDEFVLVTIIVANCNPIQGEIFYNQSDDNGDPMFKLTLPSPPAAFCEVPLHFSISKDEVVACLECKKSEEDKDCYHRLCNGLAGVE